MKLNYPILSDPTGKTAAAYKIYNKKRKFSGRFTFFIGTDGKIKHVIKLKGKDINAHGKTIAKQLDKMGVKKKK